EEAGPGDLWQSSSLVHPNVDALQPTYGGGEDAFVSKLNASGNLLLYSTYLGGNDYDVGYASNDNRRVLSLLFNSTLRFFHQDNYISSNNFIIQNVINRASYCLMVRIAQY